MLWYKNWLETRFRIVMVLAFGLVFLVLTPHNMNPGRAAINLSIFYWMFVPVILAGAGIKTQVTALTTRGLHGSMYFTLSLPVSRLRLLAVRAGLGMLETAAVIAALCCVTWAVFPALRAHFTAWDGLEYLLATTTCVSAFYFLSVLLATFFDDLWQIWGSMAVILSLRWLVTVVPVSPSLNIFRAIGESSPLFTHVLPWANMGISLGAAALLLLAAMKVVQAREY